MIKSAETSVTKAPPRSILGLLIFLFKETLRKKKWILLPLWIILIGIAIILALTGNSFILPAIYMVGF